VPRLVELVWLNGNAGSLLARFGAYARFQVDDVYVPLERVSNDHGSVIATQPGVWSEVAQRPFAFARGEHDSLLPAADAFSALGLLLQKVKGAAHDIDLGAGSQAFSHCLYAPGVGLPQH
jgi:hypothetical protein